MRHIPTVNVLREKRTPVKTPPERTALEKPATACFYFFTERCVFLLSFYNRRKVRENLENYAKVRGIPQKVVDFVFDLICG